MRALLDSDESAAKEAIELVCYRAACMIGQLSMAAGGLEAVAEHADDEGDDQHRPRAVLVRQPAARRGRSARAPARCRWPVSHRPSLGAPKRL